MSLGAGNSFEAGERFGRGNEGCDQGEAGVWFKVHPTSSTTSAK